MTLKSHAKFGKFSPQHSKVSKLGLSWSPFMNLKFTGELCIMTVKNDGKCEKKLTCQFKTDMRNLTNVGLSTQRSQKFVL